MKRLLHDDNSTQSLECLDNLLTLFLGHTLLHQLGSALDKLLAVNQRQTQHALDFLDDLGLGAGFERHELEVEQSLFLCGGGDVLLFGSSRGRSGGSTTSSKATDGQIRDVEARLRDSG
jgi:hypothetical protein